MEMYYINIDLPPSRDSLTHSVREFNPESIESKNAVPPPACKFENKRGKSCGKMSDNATQTQLCVVICKIYTFAHEVAVI